MSLTATAVPLAAELLAALEAADHACALELNRLDPAVRDLRIATQVKADRALEFATVFGAGPMERSA